MIEIGARQEARELDRAAARDRFEAVRRESEALASRLTPEDQSIQSMPDASPTKWHLAHTTWFFETFLLGPLRPGYRPFDPAFGYLFNSYYEAVGPAASAAAARPAVAAVAATMSLPIATTSTRRWRG